jgi:hypothetical protein
VTHAAAPYLLRSVTWRVELAYVVLAAAVVTHGRVVDAELSSFEIRLRLATALVAAGAGLVLDDAATRTIEASPQHRTVAVITRTLAILTVAAAGWTACVLAVPGGLSATVARALCLQAVAWIFAGLLTARTLGSSAVTVSLLTAAIAIQLLPQRWSMVSTPGAATWHDAQTRWLGVLAVLAAALIAVFRDAATPSLQLMLARRRGGRRAGCANVVDP